jgi:hypothetical protein
LWCFLGSVCMRFQLIWTVLFVCGHLYIMSCSCLYGKSLKLSACFMIIRVFRAYSSVFNVCVKQAGLFSLQWVVSFVLFYSCIYHFQFFEFLNLYTVTFHVAKCSFFFFFLVYCVYF